jgi:hypothetical protein
MSNTKREPLLSDKDISSSANHKVVGRRYNYIHSMDSRLYVTLCANCGEEVGGWTPAHADELWSSHCC